MSTDPVQALAALLAEHVRGSGSRLVSSTINRRGDQLERTELTAALDGPVEDAVMRERERWIASWTLLERGKAIEWAGAVHAGASDNDGVIVPPRPGHLDRGRPA